MASTPRKRRDSRRDTAQLALIEAAERMFAEVGVNAVSIRQIGAAIGSANPSVVTYYFGNKEALIEAVYQSRLSVIDQRRGALLAEAEKAGQPLDLQRLLHIIWLPLLEQVDINGKHSYAAFLTSLLRQGLGEMRRSVRDDFPITTAIVDRIRGLMPASIGGLWSDRWSLTTLMVLNAIELIDRKPDRPAAGIQACFDDAIVMASTALTAPVGDG